jgi:hypothetical protein
MYACLSVRPSTWNNWTDFRVIRYLTIFRKSFEKIQVSLTLSLLMYIYGAPCKARNFNAVYIYMDIRLATLKAVSFYLLHNVSTVNRCRKFCCGTVVCNNFATIQDYPKCKWDLKSDKNNGHFTWGPISFLLRMRNVLDKSFRESQNTRFVLDNFFFSRKSCCLWNNVEKYCTLERATDDSMECAHCILNKATNTH